MTIETTRTADSRGPDRSEFESFRREMGAKLRDLARTAGLDGSDRAALRDAAKDFRSTARTAWRDGHRGDSVDFSAAVREAGAALTARVRDIVDVEPPAEDAVAETPVEATVPEATTAAALRAYTTDPAPGMMALLDAVVGP